MNINYRDWKEYYQNVFLPEFSAVNDIYADFLSYSDMDGKFFLNKIKYFFEVCLRQQKLYLWYNGMFALKDRDVLRFSFYVGFLTDGDVWIEFGDIMYTKVPLDLNYVCDFVVSNFYIFENLKNNLAAAAGENG